MSRVGDEIARMRIAKGLSQKQLAKQAGVAESYISDVESGKRVLQDQLISRITKILGGVIGSEIPDEKETLPGSNGAVKPIHLPNSVPSHRGVPKTEIVYSTFDASSKLQQDAKTTWSDAFSQMLKDVPIYDISMKKQLSTRTMPVLEGKIDGYPKEKVFYVEAEDNDMIGYRIQRTDLVLAVHTNAATENGYYLIELRDKYLMRQLKLQPGGMVQITAHKGAPVREVMPESMMKVIARLLRVEIALPPL